MGGQGLKVESQKVEGQKGKALRIIGKKAVGCARGRLQAGQGFHAKTQRRKEAKKGLLSRFELEGIALD